MAVQINIQAVSPLFGTTAAAAGAAGSAAAGAAAVARGGDRAAAGTAPFDDQPVAQDHAGFGASGV